MTASPPLVKLSRLLARLSIAGMIIIPLILAVVWAELNWLITHSPEFANIGIYPERVDTGQKVLGFLISLASASLVLYGLWRLRGVFQSFEEGIFFTSATIKGIRTFALMIVLTVIVRPITGALLSVLLTLNNPSGERSLSITFGSGHIEILFVGLVFFAIAHVMSEGQKLADENAQII